jgi:hypothetical protein
LVATPGIVHSVQLRPGSGNTVLIGMCTGDALGRLTRLAFP